MQYFKYHNSELYAEEVNLVELANQVETPCYVYSRGALEENWQAFHNAFAETPHRICYAVKANSNIAILNLLARLGSGFDIVSQGELERVLAAGGNPQQIVFSGVGKKSSEIRRALEANIYCFNVESPLELTRLNTLAQEQGVIARIALRVNPNIDPQTHSYITTGLKENKFGINIDQVAALTDTILSLPHLRWIGIACHIGSQLTTLDPLLSSLDKLIELYETLRDKKIPLTHINVGGGLGIRYKDETPPTIDHYVQAVRDRLGKLPLEIILEPGRAITANTGILLTRVEYLKSSHDKNFAIVDAAMNDLMRPALYQAWQDILPVVKTTTGEEKQYDIVGPVCESADFLGKNRLLTLQPGDLLAISSAGAYGFSMSSNYNSRPRAAEVLVDKDIFHIIRARETIRDLFALESPIG